MTWGRRIGIGLLLLAVAAGLGWGFRPGPMSVDGAAVQRAPLTVTVEEEGRTRVRDRYVLSAPVAGFVGRVTLDVGDVIAAGDPVAHLQPLPSEVLDPRRRAQAEAQVARAEAALKVAQQQVAAARAQAEYARIEYQRKQRLRKDAGVSQDQLDQAASVARQQAATLRSAEFSVDVARFDLESARTALKYSALERGDTPDIMTVRSPVRGRVLKVYRESEGVVAPGESLLEVGDPAALELEVDVLSADAVRIRPGMAVRLERWGGEDILHGEVRMVEPVGFTKISALGVEEQRVWVICAITSPREQWSHLGDGYRVEAAFVLWHADDALQVPTSSLFRHGDGWAVFLVDQGVARLRAVEIGRRSGLVAQVISGVEPGDIVITHPDDRVRDGIRVEARPE